MRLVSNSHKVIFWDRPDLKNMPSKDFKRYIETLRQEGPLDSISLSIEIIQEASFLTDGTALSVFYLGHRISEGLNFFYYSKKNLKGNLPKFKKNNKS